MTIADLLKIENASVTLDAPGLRLYWNDTRNIWVIMRWGRTTQQKRPHWITEIETASQDAAARKFEQLVD